MKFTKTRLIKPKGKETVPKKWKVDAGDSAPKTPRHGPVIPSQPLPQSGEPKTRMFRPKRNKSDKKTAPSAPIDFMSNLVVGWLVVISGPGQGKASELGYGMNDIGRSPEGRVALNFGDDEISRKRHAMLTYDPKGRKFYVQHGGGANLTYLNDAPLLETKELTGGETIELGKTILRFIPLCGPDFEWQDHKKPKAPKKK